MFCLMGGRGGGTTGKSDLITSLGGGDEKFIKSKRHEKGYERVREKGGKGKIIVIKN